jgi:hypothetical protein
MNKLIFIHIPLVLACGSCRFASNTDACEFDEQETALADTVNTVRSDCYIDTSIITLYFNHADIENMISDLKDTSIVCMKHHCKAEPYRKCDLALKALIYRKKIPVSKVLHVQFDVVDPECGITGLLDYFERNREKVINDITKFWDFSF